MGLLQPEVNMNASHEASKFNVFENMPNLWFNAIFTPFPISSPLILLFLSPIFSPYSSLLYNDE